MQTTTIMCRHSGRDVDNGNNSVTLVQDHRLEDNVNVAGTAEGNNEEVEEEEDEAEQERRRTGINIGNVDQKFSM